MMLGVPCLQPTSSTPAAIAITTATATTTQVWLPLWLPYALKP